MVERNQGQGYDDADGIDDIVFLSAQFGFAGENTHCDLYGQNGHR